MNAGGKANRNAQAQEDHGMEEEIEEKELRFCKDCRFVGEPSVLSGWEYTNCEHPALSRGGKPDLVTGVPKGLVYQNASMCRGFECGREAKYFEPREGPLELKNPLKRGMWWIQTRILGLWK